jgi:hypothetical protein
MAETMELGWVVLLAAMMAMLVVVVLVATMDG